VSFEDKTIECADCGETFVHSAADQAKYAERGFESDPKRCRACREKRKARSSGGSSHRGPKRESRGPSRSGGFDRPRAASYDAVCAECGQPTTVPFKPTGARPVYCRDCFRARGPR